MRAEVKYDALKIMCLSEEWKIWADFTDAGEFKDLVMKANGKLANAKVLVAKGKGKCRQRNLPTPKDGGAQRFRVPKNA